MKNGYAAFGILLLIALVLGAGCTSPGTSTATPTAIPTPVATETPAVTATPTPKQTTSSLVPGPTDTIASYRSVDVSVEKAGTYSTTIITKFDGGKGLMATKKVETTVYTPDGRVTSCTIGDKEGVRLGDTCEAQGSTGTDRVVVNVYMNDGRIYKLIDKLMPYKTHG